MTNFFSSTLSSAPPPFPLFVSMNSGCLALISGRVRTREAKQLLSLPLFPLRVDFPSGRLHCQGFPERRKKFFFFFGKFSVSPYLFVPWLTVSSSSSVTLGGRRKESSSLLSFRTRVFFLSLFFFGRFAAPLTGRRPPPFPSSICCHTWKTQCALFSGRA